MDLARVRAAPAGVPQRERPVRRGPAPRHRRRRRRRCARRSPAGRGRLLRGIAADERAQRDDRDRPTASRSRSSTSGRSPSPAAATSAEGQAVGVNRPFGHGGARHVPYVHLGVRTTGDPNGYLDPLTFLPARSRPAGRSGPFARSTEPRPPAPKPHTTAAPAAAAPVPQPVTPSPAPDRRERTGRSLRRPTPFLWILRRRPRRHRPRSRPRPTHLCRRDQRRPGRGRDRRGPPAASICCRFRHAPPDRADPQRAHAAPGPRKRKQSVHRRFRSPPRPVTAGRRLPRRRGSLPRGPRPRRWPSMPMLGLSRCRPRGGWGTGGRRRRPARVRGPGAPRPGDRPVHADVAREDPGTPHAGIRYSVAALAGGGCPRRSRGDARDPRLPPPASGIGPSGHP